MQLYVVNVGVNLSDSNKRGIKSPIFMDGKFEFVPIKEAKFNINYSQTRYSELKCFNNLNETIADYLPEKYKDYWLHNDPDFLHMTYGDSIQSSRAKNLQKVKSGDILLFLARLFSYSGGNYQADSSQYFIGLFYIEFSAIAQILIL